MKILKIIGFFILLLSVGFNSTYAQSQQRTTYEQKVAEIKKKYIKKALVLAGKQLTNSYENELKYADDKKLDMLLSASLLIIMSQKPELLDYMKLELKQAEKLKTAVDFQREKEAQALKEQEKFAKTDAGIIRQNIKSAFEEWNLKGEFEKETDYSERLQNQSQTAFEGICLEQIKNRIENKDEYYWKKELLPYNAENEFFTVSFKINDISWQSDIDVPISQAGNFKNQFPNLSIEIDNYAWCFVENSLCPTLLTLKTQNNNTKYQIPVLLQNQSEISQSFDNIEIENKYLNGYVFKFSNAKSIAEQQKREKQRLDSLELATFNHRLDSVFQDYNKQLLSNPYNLKQGLLKDYDKITLTSTDNRQYSYDRKVSDMKSEFNSLKISFENDREKEYRQNSKLFANKSEFDDFYTQGKKIYQAEVKKRTVLKYFSDNAKFIETMDFQKEAKETVGSAFMSGYIGSYTDYSKINANRKIILSAINESQNKPYYSQLIDFVIETNKDLNKEWTKNGQYFKRKSEFYTAFLSDNYKQILKDKKKKK